MQKICLSHTQQQIQTQMQTQIPALSHEQQEKMGMVWDARVSDPRPFVPHYLRDKVSPMRAWDKNVKYGKFAAYYLKRFIAKVTTKDDIERRIANKSQLVGVGFGLGFDFRWLAQATLAGFQACVLDVSTVACGFAEKAIKEEWEKINIPDKDRRLRPDVVLAEIQSALADPKSLMLNPEKFEVMFFSRLLGCLEEESAKLVLQQVGYDCLSGTVALDSKNAVIIINTMRDRNPKLVGKTTTLWKEGDILENLQKGADRRLEVSGIELHRYYDQTVTAMTVMADPE